MIDGVLAKVFGTKHDREIKKLRPVVDAINALEPQMQALSDAELAAKTKEFKQRIANGASLDDMLIEAFAVCREAGRRVLDMRHFDVQLIGGMVLHQRQNRRDEDRRRQNARRHAAVLLECAGRQGRSRCYGQRLSGEARRGMDGPLHRFLGLDVGVIVHDLDDHERQEAYAADITYGTNNEFGFDYLRDNMKFRLEDCVQRGHQFRDRRRGRFDPDRRSPYTTDHLRSERRVHRQYYRVNRIIPLLERGEVIEGKEPGQKYTTGDFTVDEKHRSVALTEEGVLKVEKLLNTGNLYDPANIEMNHHVQQALRAHVLYQRDRDYVVQDGQVVIVDEFTGRMMPGRRWSDGLHQAVEAKEGVKIERENQTLASITFQNFFRMYKKLAGMTGTADTEAAEFNKIYKLEVTVIPTNRPMIRKEIPDVVYRTEEEKFRNAAKEIKELNEKGSRCWWAPFRLKNRSGSPRF